MSLLNLLKESQLDILRNGIDKKDSELIKLLKSRIDIAIEIAKFKKENGITVVQPNRWDEVLDNLKKYCSRVGLDYDLVIPVWDAIHKLSIKTQQQITH